MLDYRELDLRVAKECVEAFQLWDAWQHAEDLRRHSFTGSMHWETRIGREYLYRRKGKVARSLGPRSQQTENAFRDFARGKRENAERRASLWRQIEMQAAILRGLRAGRLPMIAARVLRAIGEHERRATVRVIGTSALYAYEAMAGVTFSQDVTATGEADILADDRNKLKLLAVEDQRIGWARFIQNRVDKSFAGRGQRGYRLINKDGFIVEIVGSALRSTANATQGAMSLDSRGSRGVGRAPEYGLPWLAGAPAVETLALDTRGFPVPMRCPDPRYWALHKAWISRREARDPAKRPRDRAQAEILIRLVRETMPHLPFDDAMMAGLPGNLRDLVAAPTHQTGLEPNS